MRHFFALPALLRSAAILAAASASTFSVGDDILAFPQYEVQFAEDWISEPESQSKLVHKQRYQNEHVPSSQIELQTPSPQGEDVEYEYMMASDGQRWLCGVPQVLKMEEGLYPNETQSKVEEERELARATDRGWELLSAMQGNCVFFISGWWSYSFCYNQGVKQFHQLPPSRGVPVYPPVEDPHVEGFMLGTYERRVDDDETPVKEDKWEGESALDMSEGAKRRLSSSGELVQRGESRYLVQRLGGGTLCDLTGKERRIEVQFHCNPQSPDRISLIKETSTCAYLMVIQTPRLCNDVAFLPPQKDQPHSISCKPILTDDEAEIYERELKADKAAERDARIWEANEDAMAALTGAEHEIPLQLVGDVWIGGHDIVPEGRKIEKSAIVGGGKETLVDTIASTDGRKWTKDELERLGMGDAKAVERLKKEVEQRAEGQAWKLEVIDTPRGREYRAIIGEQESSKKERVKDDSQADEAETKQDESDGSEEEYYKEEL